MALSLSSRTALLRSSLYRLTASRPLSDLPSNNSDVADEAASSSDPLLRKLEDAIHRIIVRRAQPDWLPFVPGSSYWVPPPRSTSGIAQLVDKLANPLTREHSLSTTSVRGWPSSDYFIKGGHSTEAKEGLNLPQKKKEEKLESEDEEG